MYSKLFFYTLEPLTQTKNNVITWLRANGMPINCLVINIIPLDHCEFFLENQLIYRFTLGMLSLGFVQYYVNFIIAIQIICVILGCSILIFTKKNKILQNS